LPPPTPAEIEATILRLLGEAGPGRSVGPTDAARALTEGPGWNVLMPAVRRAAIKLALAGEIAILRKGRPADPNDFKGIYRLALPRGAGSGPGSNSEV
jgi:hypothetical protein